MKIVFLGTPQFAIPFLDALVDEPGIDVVAAVTQPDKPAGRGKEMKPSPIKERAAHHGLTILTPKSLKKDEASAELQALNADAFVVVAYGKIIPQSILDIPKLGCINVHPSLLPKYRGPSPMQSAIAEGDDQTGVTIMLLDAGMDTGPILARETIGLDGDETLESLVGKVWQVGPRLLIETLKRHADGDVTPVDQSEEGASICSLLSREDGHIDWTASISAIERKVRAYDPWPGTWTVWNRNDKDYRIKILKAAPTDFENDLPPGTVAIKDGHLMIDATDGTLEILKLQMEGKPPMDSSSFLTGYSDIDGAVLN